MLFPNHSFRLTRLGQVGLSLISGFVVSAIAANATQMWSNGLLGENEDSRLGTSDRKVGNEATY